MKIHSIFHSVDGEVNPLGQGTPSVFVRLQGCNLKCFYCDTEDSLDPAAFWKDLPVIEVKNMILDFLPADLKGAKVTITGGEPLLQQDEVHQLLNHLFVFDFPISIETNGTISLEKFICQRKRNPNISLIVDYKTHLPQDKIIPLSEYNALQSWDWIKFMVGNRGGYEQVRDAIRRLNTKARIAISPLFTPGYNMTVRPKKLWEWLLEDGLKYVCLNIQIHKLIGLL